MERLIIRTNLVGLWEFELSGLHCSWCQSIKYQTSAKDIGLWLTVFMFVFTAACITPDRPFCNQPLTGNTTLTFTIEDCKVNALICPGLCGLCKGWCIQ